MHDRNAARPIGEPKISMIYASVQLQLQMARHGSANQYNTSKHQGKHQAEVTEPSLYACRYSLISLLLQ
jgi:hypothetical protein